METIIAVLCSIIASSGFWAFVLKYSNRNDAKSQLIMGLAHDRILTLGETYIARGYITNDEYENIEKYLYRPYEKMGGNGSAKRIMERVKNLPPPSLNDGSSVNE